VNGPDTTETDTTTKKSRFVKIPINFADVYDIADAFGGTVITSRFGQGGGFGGGMGGASAHGRHGRRHGGMAV